MREFEELNLVGQSSAFLCALALIKKFSCCDATVWIQGETGTGKELAARALHYLGVRRNGPFIAVNCGALPEALVESELFGHTRGAFTDAKEARSGIVAEAQGGTLFLDEIDSMNIRAQVALLRFLEQREYRPVGGATVKRADVRVIAASNADLELLVVQKRFREDLLYRLNVLSLNLPALRDREGDVRLLAEEFLLRLCRQYKTPLKKFGEETLTFLHSHSWRGNVRELENFILRQFLLTDGLIIRADNASDAQYSATSAQGDRLPATHRRFKDAKAHAIADFERAYLVELLHKSKGNISLAARLAGKDRSRLGKLAKKYGLDRQIYVSDNSAA